LSPGDRVLVLAPHPDDEVLGGGGLLQQAAALGLPVRVVFLTSGEANLWSYAVDQGALRLTPARARQLGMMRRAEALAADAALGIPPDHLTFLGYPDHGTLAMWTSHWGLSQRFQSPWTQATGVPYPNAYRPGAAYKGEDIVADLTAILRDLRPTKILVSHAADVHPDHLALYLFTRVALWSLEGELTPELYPYLVHYPAWPQPARYDPGLALTPPASLAGKIGWGQDPLPAGAVAAKLAALKKHRTQYGSDGIFLRQLVRANELFGDFPGVPLAPGGTALLVAPEDEKLPLDIPAELTSLKRGLFAELESIAIRRDGGDLVMTIAFSRPLQRETQVSLFVFGARPDRPFSAMPKLHVELGAHGEAAYDQARRLPAAAVTVRREANTAAVKIPLGLLGDPDRLLVGGRSSVGRVPLAASPWRIVILR